MAYGLSFQPSTDQIPAERRSTVSALGPGQRALKILAMHLPKMMGGLRAGAPSAPGHGGMSPDQAVFQALVQSIQGAPLGGHPTTGPLVDTFANLSPAHSPQSPSNFDRDPFDGITDYPKHTGDFLGDNGEWMPGPGELGGPVDSLNDPNSMTFTPGANAGLFHQLVQQLGGGRR